jgi:endoglucanase
MSAVAAATSLLQGCEAVASAAAPASRAPSGGVADWPQWAAFVEHFVEPSGRVIDHSTADKATTSEGQSYAMFFALVANDQANFDRLWRWSLANLAPSGLDKQLPAWRWGQKADGAWGVIDANAAADADLWFAYSLLEAERFWGDTRYGAQARQLLKLVRRDEVVEVSGLGPMLLPGPQGFMLGAEGSRFNASYSVLPLFRRFAASQPEGPWADLALNALRMIEATTPRGVAPDWTLYRPGDGFLPDPVQGDLGSYDAIRVYLWAGITPAGDPLRGRLLRSLSGMSTTLKLAGPFPEKFKTTTGEASGQAPPGFHAAVLPFLEALGERGSLGRIEGLLEGGLKERAELHWAYYDHVLALFALGHRKRRYHFTPQGQLVRRLS